MNSPEDGSLCEIPVRKHRQLLTLPVLPRYVNVFAFALRRGNTEYAGFAHCIIEDRSFGSLGGTLF
jgi:hypothetical protein